MADNQITKDVYKQYANKIVSVLKNEDFYEQFKKRVDKGSSSFKLAKKRLIQDISIDWIDTIEEILPNLDTIVRNPRKFIVQEEDIVDVSLARSISTESVKFLAQHTNMISKVDKDGMVTPSKILNITKEESFEIYENRFIYTLLLKLKDFVTMRYDKIKKASATQDVLELDVESRFGLPSKKVTFRTEYFAQLSFDEVMRLDPDTLTKIERVAKIDRIITDFLSSSFAKSMRNSAPVRPPIMRTNVILKEPNFKKALTLWQFIETYNVSGGFSTSDEVENYDIENDSVENLKNMVTLNTMLFESMYDQHETDMNMEDKEFADFLRVGEMEFEKDELNRDEYAQKLDDKLENEEADKNEEVTPQEGEEAERDLDIDDKHDEDETKQEDKEHQPEVEEQQKETDKEIPQEVEVERLVEVERYKEMPPKADQEEVDLDPDAEKFDQHLYDVRKLYKRPDDDKLKQEDIIKVKDAIDRCLTSYRRIKQEEIDDREREERIRHRRADMAKRADALKKARAELENEVKTEDDDSVYFGIDPFSYQRAKLAAQKKEEERIAQRKKLLSEIERAKEEKLELEDRDVKRIEQSIEDMERKRAEQDELNRLIEEELDEEEANATAMEEEAKEAALKAEEEALKAEEEPLEPVDEEPADDNSVEDVSEEPVDEEPVEEVSDEPILEEVAEPIEEPVEAEMSSEEEVGEPADEPSEVEDNVEATEESNEDEEQEVDVEEPIDDNSVEEVLEEPVDEEPVEDVSDEPIREEVTEPIEEPVEAVPEEQVQEELAPEEQAQEEPSYEEPAPEEQIQEEAIEPPAPKKKRKKKNIEVVDESKVSVGGIRFKEGFNLSDPYNLHSVVKTRRAPQNTDSTEE